MSLETFLSFQHHLAYCTLPAMSRQSAVEAAASVTNPHLVYQQTSSNMAIRKALTFDLPLMIGTFQFVVASLQK